MNYFTEPANSHSDMLLQMATGQGYVPVNCLLGGRVVMALVNEGKDPCKGCEGPRDLSKGRSKA